MTVLVLAVVIVLLIAQTMRSAVEPTRMAARLVAFSVKQVLIAVAAVVVLLLLMVACQKHEAAPYPAAARPPAAKAAGATPRSDQPSITPAQADLLVARGMGAYVPTKMGAKYGLVVVHPPDRMVVLYHLNDNAYIDTGEIHDIKSPSGAPYQLVGTDGKIQIMPGLLAALERHIVTREMHPVNAQQYVEHGLALYIPTPANPKGGLVYESMDGYSALYRLDPVYGYRFVEEIPHILVNGKAKLKPTEIATFQARLAKP